MNERSLQTKDDAPKFKVDDLSGQKVDLSKFSNSYVLIAFLRYSGCPWCNLAIHRLALEQPLLKDSGCEIITFIQSSKSAIEKNILDRHKVTPQFPIIADPEMKIYKEYSVKPSVLKTFKHTILNIPPWVSSVYKEGYRQSKVDGKVFIAPATFLIAPGSQKIIRIDYNADLYDNSSFTKIYEAIANFDIHGFD